MKAMKFIWDSTWWIWFLVISVLIAHGYDVLTGNI